MHVYVIEIMLYMPFKCQSVLLIMMAIYVFCKNVEKAVENRQKSKAENENHI